MFRLLTRIRARMGHPRSMLLAGIDCETADQTAEGLMKANAWYRQAVAVGVTEAKWHLGVNYLGVKGGEKRPDDAIVLLTEAADAGHLMAMWTLGMLYLKGSAFIDKNIEKGLHWLHAAAETGHSRSCDQLAVIYRDGEYSVEADPAEAERFRAMALSDTPLGDDTDQDKRD